MFAEGVQTLVSAFPPYLSTASTFGGDVDAGGERSFTPRSDSAFVFHKKAMFEFPVFFKPQEEEEPQVGESELHTA